MNHLRKEINVKHSCDINTNNEIAPLRTAHTSWMIPIKPIFCFIFSPFYISKNAFYILDKIKGKSFFYTVNVCASLVTP